MCQADALSSGFELFGDFDVEDTGPFASGNGADSVVTCVQCCYMRLPSSLEPQAKQPRQPF